MTDIIFTAPEYQQDRSLLDVQYRFSGGQETGWQIERDGKPWLALGAGYVPVKTLYCGICATDLARHLLPFPLPQITGHELIGEYRNRAVAIEINASHAARGIGHDDCVYCRNGLDSHCPERMTLGIDRLPGGFSPWILAPVRAIHKLPAHVSPLAGVLIEPFAAAVRAVETTPPQAGGRIAVLGPRRLGMLLIAALDSYRKIHHTEFEIVAVMRHATLQQTAMALGADRVICLKADHPQEVYKRFDVVFDTTGNPDGLELAVKMARRAVHLKSTHGRAVMGLEHMTALVINEQSLQVYNEQHVLTCLADSLDWRGKRLIYISPLVFSDRLAGMFTAADEIVSDLNAAEVGADLQNQFEFAIVGSLEEINRLTRPISVQGHSLLRAQGVILLDPAAFKDGRNGLLDRIGQGDLQLATSRCGSFAAVLDIFRQRPELAERLKACLVTQTLPLERLAEAMRLASRSDKSIKLVIQTG